MYKTFSSVTRIRKDSQLLAADQRENNDNNDDDEPNPSSDAPFRYNADPSPYNAAKDTAKDVSSNLVNFGFVGEVESRDGSPWKRPDPTALEGNLDEEAPVGVQERKASDERESVAPRHDPLYLFFLVLCLLVHLFSIVLFLLMVHGGSDYKRTWFGSRQRDIFRNSTLWIHPSQNGDNLWFMLQIFAGMWIVYAASTVCREGDGGPLYIRPGVIPRSTFVLWIFALLCFDATPFVAAQLDDPFLLPFLVASGCFAALSLQRSALHLAEIKDWLLQRSFVDLKLSGALAISSPSAFVALNVYLIFTSFCGLFVDLDLVSMETSCTTGLVILAVLVLAGFFFEILFFDRILRQLSGHYFFLTVMLVFVFLNPVTPQDSVFHKINLTTIVLTSILAVGKIVVGAWRERREKRMRERGEGEE